MTDHDTDALERFLDAFSRGDIATAQELLGTIENINSYDGSSTPLMWAVRSRNVDLVRFLLDNSAGVACCNFNMSTALHRAAVTENNVDVLRLLIERGAAAATDRHPIQSVRGIANLRCLLEAGARPERALVAAAGNQLIDVVDELIDSGVDVDASGVVTVGPL